ncbi:hypothetical protein D5086_004311 [Populus alba]|uniref:Uncharacterized protein n=1 Tax=Populus alba TaxID=43335 RepID=A0ACC4CRH1_POPAL
MSFDEDDESFEHTLLVVREVSVYKIPPRSTSGGYKCGEWLQSDKIWSGRLRVVSCKERCEIRLEDPNSGFTERNEAFDFNVALSDHEKYVRRENEKESGETSESDAHIDIHPAVNHRLKEGETIRINVKPKPSSGAGMLSAAGLSGSATGKPKTLVIAPPPTGAGKPRSPLPPPPNDPAAARKSAVNNFGIGLKAAPRECTPRSTDSLSDLSPLEVCLLSVYAVCVLDDGIVCLKRYTSLVQSMCSLEMLKHRSLCPEDLCFDKAMDLLVHLLIVGNVMCE